MDCTVSSRRRTSLVDTGMCTWRYRSRCSHLEHREVDATSDTRLSQYTRRREILQHTHHHHHHHHHYSILTHAI